MLRKDFQKKLLWLLVILFAVSSFAGCAQRFLDFTVISTKNTQMRFAEGGKGPRVIGEDHNIAICFFVIPLKRPDVMLKAAIDKAIESAGTEYDALIDGVLYVVNGPFKSGYKIEGTAVNTSKLLAYYKEDGEGDSLAYNKAILYHSSLKISNEEAIKEVGIVQASK